MDRLYGAELMHCRARIVQQDDQVKWRGPRRWGPELPLKQVAHEEKPLVTMAVSEHVQQKQSAPRTDRRHF